MKCFFFSFTQGEQTINELDISQTARTGMLIRNDTKYQVPPLLTVSQFWNDYIQQAYRICAAITFVSDSETSATLMKGSPFKGSKIEFHLEELTHLPCTAWRHYYMYTFFHCILAAYQILQMHKVGIIGLQCRST